MSENDKPKVDTNSANFKQGVEAGLNSEEDTKNWKAGNELGQELKEEGETKKPVEDVLLFLRNSPEGNKENAQDEKDAMGE